MSRRSTTGNGDVCPLSPEHGQMMFPKHGTVQFCPDQSHDGLWRKGVHLPPTRATWPTGHDSFRRAVLAATLPELPMIGA